MSQEVSDAFIRQYESDVFVAYQRMGSKLKNTVRNKSGVNGSSTTFQKVGKGAAVQKARHAEISTMEVPHDPVECVLQDWYAGLHRQARRAEDQHRRAAGRLQCR